MGARCEANSTFAKIAHTKPDFRAFFTERDFALGAHAPSVYDLNMKTFPIMLTLQDKSAVVIGAGSVGLRRVQALQDAGANVTLITGAGAKLDQANKPDCKIIESDYTLELIENADIVFACTDSSAVNSQISADARERKILVNAADQNDDCDFFMPAVHRDEDIVIAIGTGGKAPAATGLLKRRIQKALPERMGEFVSLIDQYRTELKKTEPDLQKRMDIMKALCDEETLEEYRTGKHRALRFRYSLAISGQLPSQRSTEPDKIETSNYPYWETTKLVLLGAILIAGLFAGVSAWLGSESSKSIVRAGHGILALAGLMLFWSAAFFGIKYLRTARKLRDKNPQTILKPGLSLEALDIRCKRMLRGALVLLSAAISLGAYSALAGISSNWLASSIAYPKIALSVLGWAVAVIACASTFSRNFKGKRTAIFTIVSTIIITAIAVIVAVMNFR